MRVCLAEAHVDGDAPERGAPIDAYTALRELMRSRLELHGPVTATVLGAPLGLSADAIAVALLALEQQGYVMRGTFTPEAIAARDTEWCERRRLARIHRYTRDRKRSEEHTSELQSLMRNSYAVFCLKKKKHKK